MSYRITPTTEIYLYGAASIGKIVFQNLLDYNVKGFIDVRGNEIDEMCSKPVFSLDEMTEHIDKKSVLIITVKNVFEHDEIAYALYKKGYTNIVYKPQNALSGNSNEEENKLSALWDEIVADHFDCKSIDVPEYQSSIAYNFTDFAKLKEEREAITANVPIELVYTNNVKSIWGNINIQALYPHILFFHFLENKQGGEIKSYIELCEQAAYKIGDVKVTDAWKRNVIKNRTMIYEQMNKYIDIDIDFFVRNAPTAIWNPKGYFNLTSGKHRAAFLVSKGKRYIPLKVSSSDYSLWMGQTECQKVKRDIIQNRKRSIKHKVHHPFFIHFPCTEAVFYTRFQSAILMFLCKESRIKGRNINVVTNLEKHNSIMRLLENSIFVNLVYDKYKRADVAIIDMVMEHEKTYFAEKRLVITEEKQSENVLAQYVNMGRLTTLYCINEGVL